MTSLENQGYASELIRDVITRQEVADALGCTAGHVARMLAAYREDFKKDIQAENWEAYLMMLNNH